MDEQVWKIVCDWSARIHQWAEDGLSRFGLTCQGMRAPLAYVVYEDRAEPVTFPSHQEQATLQHLRDRVHRGDGIGVVWVSETKMKAVPCWMQLEHILGMMSCFSTRFCPLPPVRIPVWDYLTGS